MNKTALFVWLLFWASTALAEELQNTDPVDLTESHWGVGVGAGWINDYPGAAQGRERFLVVPTYKGKQFTIDRQEGIKGELLSQSRFKFSLSFSVFFIELSLIAQDTSRSLAVLFSYSFILFL